MTSAAALAAWSAASFSWASVSAAWVERELEIVVMLHLWIFGGATESCQFVNCNEAAGSRRRPFHWEDPGKRHKPPVMLGGYVRALVRRRPRLVGLRYLPKRGAPLADSGGSLREQPSFWILSAMCWVRD